MVNAGKDMQLLIGESTNNVITFHLLKGLQTATMEINAPAIRQNNVSHGIWAYVAGNAGQRSLVVQASGLHHNLTADRLLRQSAMQADNLLVRLQFNSEESLDVTMVITSYEVTYPQETVNGFDIILVSADVLNLSTDLNL